MREENDWLARQVSLKPRKLIAFFSVNPLDKGALGEIRRCAASKRFRGLKLHLANSGVDLLNPKHQKQLEGIFTLVNEYKLPVVMHLRTKKMNYGAPDVISFLRIIEGAPDISIQVAHMAGWGGYDEATDSALTTFIDAIKNNHSLKKRIFFDISATIRPNGKNDAEKFLKLTNQIRELGTSNILFGSDWPEWAPSDYKTLMKKHLKLSEQELSEIFKNRAPWVY